MASQKEFGEYLKSLLDDRRDQIERIVDTVLNPQENLKAWVPCPRCEARAGRNMKTLEVEVPIPKYNLKEITSLLRWASEFGIAKPAQKVEQEIRVSPLLDELDSLTDEELERIAAG